MTDGTHEIEAGDAAASPVHALVMRCKCTRCRNTHNVADRTMSARDRQGFTHSQCPRCKGRTYTKVQA